MEQRYAFYRSLRLILFLLCASSSLYVVQMLQIESRDMSVLREVYSKFSGVSNAMNVPDSTICAWFNASGNGNTYDICASKHVKKFQLNGMQLDTSLFPLVCKFSALETLELSNNSLKGRPDLTRCENLVSLNLSCNSLQSNISFVYLLGKLHVLDLAQNRLKGSLEYVDQRLPNLRVLNLSHNFFTNDIPFTRNLDRLEEVSLSFNNFSGEIAKDIGSYSNLSFLDLSQNNLSSRIPDVFGSLTKLEYLVLSGNNLDGTIPQSVFGIKTLVYFSANSNKLNGTLPKELGSMGNLKLLDLSYNYFSGMIPEEIFKACRSLLSIDLSHNSLQGKIPDSVYRCSKLQRIMIGLNKLNGSISSQIGTLDRLQTFQANGNQLEGEIPREISHCNLSFLDLSANKLSGQIPVTLGKRLRSLNLSRNHLGGKFSDSWLNSEMLSFDLSWNRLSGIIPDNVYQKNLQFLLLSNNKFTGNIPAGVPDGCRLLELDLASNKLGGRIPPEISKFTMLQVMLNLSHNNLGGKIPPELSSLTKLVLLDLSNNNLSGGVPKTFSGLESLELLDVSYNILLSGSLPKFGKFTNVNSNGTSITVPEWLPAGKSENIEKGFRFKLFLGITLAGAVMGVIALLSIAITCKFYLPQRTRSVAEEHPETEGRYLNPDRMQRESIDFECALKGTLDPENLMLKLKLNEYYKVTMPSATSYTVKKLKWVNKILKPEELHSFGSFIEAVAKFKHPNIMAPLAYASGLDTVVLIYENCYKGNVADFLRGESKNALDWISRYRIALGVARGIAHLHGCCPPLIHLDISTRNIFLRSQAEPQICDVELCQVGDNAEYASMISATAGYIPPEYAYTMTVTTASNVYSFGVVLLELLTGLPPIVNGMELSVWVKQAPSRDETWEQILDPRISTGSFEVRTEMMSVLKIALQCTNLSSQARPGIRTVMEMLQVASYSQIPGIF